MIGWIFSLAVAVLVYFLIPKQAPKKDKFVTEGKSYAQATREAKSESSVLDTNEWRPFILVKKTEISPNTAIYRFKLPNDSDTIDLPIGQHVSLMAEINGKEISRSYTPISSNTTKGFFDLLVKWYSMGNISKHLHMMKIGESIMARGPKGSFNYSPNMVKHIGMIAGGTGITPMYQIITAVLCNAKSDKTRLSLIFANVTYDDILLKKELDELASKHPEQFNVHYVLNTPPIDANQVSKINKGDFPWKGGVGFVTKDMIEAHLPAPAVDTRILMCGPPPMLKAMSQHVESLGFEAPRVISKPNDQVFKF